MPDLRLLRADWTKLVSVRRWVLAFAAAAVVTVVFSMLIASGSGVDIDGENLTVGPDGQPVTDDFHFVHQPLAGDGTMTALVATQTAVAENGNATEPQSRAKAGVMIKESISAGSQYAAVMTTPEHGVRMQSNFTTDEAGSASSAPQWVRIVRDGTTITGYESPNGREWNEVGSVTLDDLPSTLEVGFFVASPAEMFFERRAGSSSVGAVSTMGVATFDNVSLEPAEGQLSEWVDDDIGMGWSRGPAKEVDGVFTVTGSGDIADNPPDDDVVQISLIGVIIGSLVFIAVSVLFVTSEYQRGMIRTTFAAAGRRSQVLVSKAIVSAAVTFVVGLVASVTAFYLAQPTLRENGFAPPRFPEPSLSDPAVLRAVVGSAALLAVIAVLSVGIGVIVRRSAAAIALVIALFFLPAFLSLALPPAPAEWLVRLTPASGLAIQRALEPTKALIEPWAMIPPWVGFGVLCLYAGAALALAMWLLNRRDA